MSQLQFSGKVSAGCLAADDGIFLLMVFHTTEPGDQAGRGRGSGRYGRMY